MKKSQYEYNKQITAWEVLLYGIYALVCLFSRNSLARSSLVRLVKTNKLVRKYRMHALPMW